MSRRVWERHEDALRALEEARDIDTKRLSSDQASGTLPHHQEAFLELEKKRLGYEASRTSMMRIITFLASGVALIALLILFGGEEMKKKVSGDAVEVLTPDDLKGKKLDDLGGLDKVKEAFRSAMTGSGNRGLLTSEGDVRSLLMFGPPGCGKTEIAKAAAAEYKHNYIEVTGGKIIGSYLGQSGQNIRRYFKMARANQPCILFFDEVETVLKKRGGGRGRSEEDDRTVSEFLTEMNSVFDSKDKVLIIGATNLPESLDDAAVRRFHRRLYIPVPGRLARIKVLRGKTGMAEFDENKANEKDESKNGKALESILKTTHGFSGADLNSCVKTVSKRIETDKKYAKYFKHLRDAAKTVKDRKELKLKDSMITMDDLAVIIKESCKSTVRSTSLASFRDWAKQFGERPEEEDAPKEGERRALTAFDLDDEERKMAERMIKQPTPADLGFDGIAGLDNVKLRLKGALDMMISKQDLIRQGILTPQKEFLLFGPPGTGKSRIAMAAAKYAHEQFVGADKLLKDQSVNFMSVQASDVKGSHHGESEKNLTRVFRIAEAYQPCVMFIDEIETLLINRNNQQNDGGVGAAVLGTFLQIMDGPNVDPARMVMVIGATNKPDNLDSAVQRRFIELYVPLPDMAARAEMFRRAVYGGKGSVAELCKSGENKEFYTEDDKGIAVLKPDSDLEAALKQHSDNKTQTGQLSDCVALLYIAANTAGYSGADITRVIKTAKDFAYETWWEKYNNMENFKGQISGKDIQDALYLVPSSVNLDDVKYCERRVNTSDSSASVLQQIRERRHLQADGGADSKQIEEAQEIKKKGSLSFWDGLKSYWIGETKTDEKKTA